MPPLFSTYIPVFILLVSITAANAPMVPGLKDQGELPEEFLFLTGDFRSFETGTLGISCAGLLLDAAGNDLQLGLTPRSRRNITIYTDVQTEVDTVQSEGGKLSYTQMSVVPPLPQPAGLIGNHKFSKFDVSIAMKPRQRIGWRAWIAAESIYPWDEWAGEIVFVAVNASSSEVFPLHGFQTGDTFTNYRMTTSAQSSCIGPNVESCELSVTILMRRLPVVKVCVVGVVVFNWCFTAAMVALTRMSLYQGQEPLGMVVLAAALAIFYTMPTLKSWLGDTTFASLIDLVGMYPQIAVNLLCLVFRACWMWHR